jgi:hypothetical protein
VHGTSPLFVLVGELVVTVKIFPLPSTTFVSVGHGAPPVNPLMPTTTRSVDDGARVNTAFRVFPELAAPWAPVWFFEKPTACADRTKNKAPIIERNDARPNRRKAFEVDLFINLLYFIV